MQALRNRVMIVRYPIHRISPDEAAELFSGLPVGMYDLVGFPALWWFIPAEPGVEGDEDGYGLWPRARDDIDIFDDGVLKAWSFK